MSPSTKRTGTGVQSTNHTSPSALAGESTSRAPLPTPPHSEHNRQLGDEEETADLQNASSQRSPQRRHDRGGRKRKSLEARSSHVHSVSEIELPTRTQNQDLLDEQQEPLSDDDGDYDDYDEEHHEQQPSSPLLEPQISHSRTEYDDEALNAARRSRSQEKSNLKHDPEGRPKATGVSSFNVRRPRGGGRKPPIAVSVERAEDKPKSRSRTQKKREKKKAEEEEEEEEKEEDSSTERSTGEGVEGDKEEARKPVQIRLDLNLELEVLFKAKIKGDVTITFLE